MGISTSDMSAADIAAVTGNNGGFGNGGDVAPSQSVMLMDSENEVFYIKTVDASGMPLPLRIFDYKERNAQEKEAEEIPQIDMSNYITREEFEKRMNGISRKGRNNNGKSSVQSTE